MPQRRQTHPEGSKSTWRGVEYEMKGGSWQPVPRAPVDPIEAKAQNDAREEDLKGIYTTGRAERRFLESGVPAQARALLDRADTGTWAPLRREVGRALPKAITDSVGFIPDKDEVAAMDRLAGLSGQFTLGEAAKLKGPISEKELKFLREMVLGLGQSEEANRMFINAREWAARRASEYARQRERWTAKRPADIPVAGMRWPTFDDWWAEYANEHIPAPPEFRAYVESDGRVRPGQRRAAPATTRNGAPKRDTEWELGPDGQLRRRR